MFRITGQIAVMVEYLDGRPLPFGQGQIAYARSVVTERFGQASALFALDRLVKAVIALISGLVEGVMTILPIPGLAQVMGAVRAYLKVAVGLVDEVIVKRPAKPKAE